ncbi:hypothetical protein LTR66_016549 [Elasticomyces elasticus]|nr:hypothetical protein LTR66_016549 [Elasticomyces elasticus]
MATTLPSFKVEHHGNGNVKMEDLDMASPSIKSENGDASDIVDPELDFKNMSTKIWTSKVPKFLWEILANATDDEEIEIDRPEKVSMLLAPQVVQRHDLEQEWNVGLKPMASRKSRRNGDVMMFTEKNLPGFRERTNAWDNVDDDGNIGQSRSYLWEAIKRDEKKKENKGRWIPYQKKTIPKITALQGTVTQEFEITPVDNTEHREKDKARTRALLAAPVKQEAQVSTIDPSLQYGSIVSTADRQKINKQAQKKRQDAKDNRTAREDRSVIIERILSCYQEYKVWGVRALRDRLRQPESYIKEVLDEIGFMHKSGDWNGKWELKEAFKTGGFDAATEAAPEAEDSDVDMKSDDEDFEDVV